MKTILSRMLDGGDGTLCTRSRSKTDHILTLRALGEEADNYKTAFGRWAGLLLRAYERALKSQEKDPDKYLGNFLEVMTDART